MALFDKIIIPTRPQPDTILAIFLLKNFGTEKYAGIESARIEIMQQLPEGETPESMEEKATLVLDVGKGKFDHHETGKTLSQIIAKDLGILEEPALQKLLSYTERDDKHGLGTISNDPLDKAFGLSGLIVSLNKTFPDKAEKIIEIVSILIRAHYLEEKKRTEELPKEFKEKLEAKQAEVFEVKQGKKDLKVVVLESSSVSMAGWLRSVQGIKADVVCQKMSSGYVNIITRPLKKVDLRWVVAHIRNEEALAHGKNIQYLNFDLMNPGKIAEVPEWYYDRATNSILNGGTNPKGIKPTAIDFRKMGQIVKEALGRKV